MFIAQYILLVFCEKLYIYYFGWASYDFLNMTAELNLFE